MTRSTAYHEHRCPHCETVTVHHVYDHEEVGDNVKFWWSWTHLSPLQKRFPSETVSSTCEKDVYGTIGDFVASC
jgi:hypothetical protein